MSYLGRVKGYLFEDLPSKEAKKRARTVVGIVLFVVIVGCMQLFGAGPVELLEGHHETTTQLPQAWQTTEERH